MTEGAEDGVMVAVMGEEASDEVEVVEAEALEIEEGDALGIEDGEMLETEEEMVEGDEFEDSFMEEEDEFTDLEAAPEELEGEAVVALDETTLEEEEEKQEKGPSRFLFVIGVIITIVGMGAAGGSEIHNTLNFLGSNWEAYGPLDQMTGISGAIVLIVGILIMAVALKKMKDQEEEESACPECGTLLSANEVRCPECGTEFAE